MPVPRNHLSRHGVHLEAELLAYVLLDSWIDRRVRAHRAADPTDPGLFRRVLQTSERAIQLRDPACNFETKCDRLGDDAMGSAGHQSSAMPDGQLRSRFARP